MTSGPDRSGWWASRGSPAAPESATGWRSFDNRFSTRIWPDALAGHAVDLTDLSSSVRGWPSVRPKPEPYDPPASRSGQRLQHLLELVLEQRETIRASTATTASESSMKSPSWLSPSSPIVWSERDRLPRVTAGSPAPFSGVNVHFPLASSSGVGSRPRSCREFALDAAELVDDFDHVDGDADGAGLVGHGAGDGLGGSTRWRRWRICSPWCSRIFSTARMRPRLPSWMRSRKAMAAAGVALGEGDDQTQVRFEQMVLLRPAHPSREIHIRSAVHVGPELLPRPSADAP